MRKDDARKSKEMGTQHQILRSRLTPVEYILERYTRSNKGVTEHQWAIRAMYAGIANVSFPF